MTGRGPSGAISWVRRSRNPDVTTNSGERVSRKVGGSCLLRGVTIHRRADTETRALMKPEDYSRREQQLAGWPIVVESYKLGDIYHCSIESADPGARFARADG